MAVDPTEERVLLKDSAWIAAHGPANPRRNRAPERVDHPAFTTPADSVEPVAREIQVASAGLVMAAPEVAIPGTEANADASAEAAAAAEPEMKPAQGDDKTDAKKR